MPRERRKVLRRGMNQPLRVLPILENGYPDSDHFRMALTRDLSSEGIGWEVAVHDWYPRWAFVVGLAMPDGLWHYAGVEVCHANPSAAGRVCVGGRFGGHGRELLQAANLTPAFHTDTLRFTQHFSDEMLQKWAETGILQRDTPKWVQLRPQCRGLPTFRPGCRQCGSADVGNDQLIHHFACAHVGRVGDFETPAGLVCPKCRTKQLIVGSDYEYVTGP
jgi:hypothetical protein